MFLSDYYREAIDRVRRELRGMADDEILGHDPQKLGDYYYQKYALPCIEVDPDRQITYDRGKPVEHDADGWGLTVTPVTVVIPIKPHPKNAEVLAMIPLSLTLSRGEDGIQFTLWTRSGQEEATAREIKGHLDRIRDSLTRSNDDIKAQNETLARDLRALVQDRQARVREDIGALDKALEKAQVRLVRRQDARALCVDLRVRQ